jgi:hypothetical protein
VSVPDEVETSEHPEGRLPPVVTGQYAQQAARVLCSSLGIDPEDRVRRTLISQGMQRTINDVIDLVIAGTLRVADRDGASQAVLFLRVMASEGTF